MEHGVKLQKKLVGALQDAYAMENQIVEILQNHAAQAMSFPDIQAQVRLHLEQTKVHRTRMEERLSAHGVRPSAVKSAGTTILGNVIGAVSMLRSDVPAKNARDEYVTEHLEIAVYTLLIATARVAGDEETVRAAAANLRDEEEMQRWLLQHLPEVGVRALEEDGIVIDPETRGAATAPDPDSAGSGGAGSGGGSSAMPGL